MTDLVTLINKEIKRFLRVWPQTLVPPIITLTLYLVVFGKFIWSQVGDIKWVEYMNFIIPGLIMMSIIMASYSNSSSSFFASKLFWSIDELLVSSITKTKILVGFTVWSIIRALIVGFLGLGVSFFFGDIVIENYFYFVVFIVLTSTVFSLAGLLNAILAKTFDQINMVPTFLITPLIYLGWVFYSINMLPYFWETVSQFNPILYLINWFRYSFLGITDVNINWAIFVLFLFIIILFYINYYFLKNYRK